MNWSRVLLSFLSKSDPALIKMVTNLKAINEFCLNVVIV